MRTEEPKILRTNQDGVTRRRWLYNGREYALASKAWRQYEVDNLVVLTDSAKALDADETSQTRLLRLTLRAALAHLVRENPELGEAQVSDCFKCADDVFRTLSVAEALDAASKAEKEQSAIWVKYG